MATAKKAPAKKVTTVAKKAPAKKAVATKAAPAKKAAAPAKKAPAAVSVIKTALNKSQLVTHLVEQTGVEAKSVKLVLASLEGAVLASVNKKGAGEFALPGLFKVSVQKVAAKPKRFGKDPFSGEERWFPAKPASVKVKVRPLKKLKDAAQ
ncbi:HU family DNA-binding protein [Bordetella sp. N]|jgi:nucleoid DNA-binding protein|uniref:HU family DNA-binding protein n=1 Tax=Bordetella sp. N TaxID=1746199 RepID=UPI00070E6222|nr:HU family DNA-binding protein [Bordetella sp. N]ALM84187.1 DNA-binding protein [Bordetella sp. N]